MKRLSSGLFAGMLLAAIATPPPAGAAVPDAMRRAQYLVGTWNCAHTVGDFSGTYREAFVPAFGGRWLKQTYEFPATATERAVRAEYFIEYDERVPRWVRFGAHSNGQYYGQYSTSSGRTGWRWDYVLPNARANRSIWTKRSATEYTIDGPTYPENGKPVTEHHVCKKLE